MSLVFKPGENLLFIGDSITDAGRSNHLPPYGGGYMSMFRNMILAKHPDLGLSFINKGICGNTLEGLELRWNNDVIDESPEHLFILVGINDAAMQNDSYRNDLDVLNEFRNRYRDIIQKTQSKVKNIILITPFFISDNTHSPLLKLCKAYGDVVKDIANEFHLKTIDLQAHFEDKLKNSTPDFWSGDGIHPHPHGHYSIAEKIYEEVLGC